MRGSLTLLLFASTVAARAVPKPRSADEGLPLLTHLSPLAAGLAFLAILAIAGVLSVHCRSRAGFD
ncbi:hypothetical protein C8R46DRAFT_1213557 [Mycena filopes]|nr:hypothetical protein C8R46DRAFT_1213557 [Mycena filopes]